MTAVVPNGYSSLDGLFLAVHHGWSKILYMRKKYTGQKGYCTDCSVFFSFSVSDGSGSGLNSEMTITSD